MTSVGGKVIIYKGNQSCNMCYSPASGGYCQNCALKKSRDESKKKDRTEWLRGYLSDKKRERETGISRNMYFTYHTDEKIRSHLIQLGLG